MRIPVNKGSEPSISAALVPVVARRSLSPPMQFKSFRVCLEHVPQKSPEILFVRLYCDRG
jgi:hypothetical protein